jgi:hypothetical protein
MSQAYESLAERLDAIAEDLADAAIAELKDAVRVGAGRPASEKRLTQARRSVEKAAHLLRSLDGDDGDDARE